MPIARFDIDPAVTTLLHQLESGMISFTDFARVLSDQHRIHITSIHTCLTDGTMVLDLTRDCTIDDQTLEWIIEQAALLTNYKL